MVKHIVCFKLSDPTPENCRKAAEVLMSMKGNIDYLREIEVGVDFLHSARSFDVILSVVVDSKEALEVYQQDKYHCDVVKTYMRAVTEKSVTVDFEF